MIAAEEAAARQAVIACDGLARRFGGTEALAGLTLQVSAGEIYGLVGCDGAGKTTAMRILAGLIAPDGGKVEVLGQNPMSRASELRSALGYMPQHYSLYGDLTVEENLRFFSRMFCQGKAEYAERRERLLQITRLGPFVDRRADALSGGMYKKLALACSLLPRPRALLLDEPTNGVDPVSRRELWALLFELVAEGMAIVISTAYMDEAARCHRVGLIHRGALLREGLPAELLERFDHSVIEIAGEDRAALDALLDSSGATLASAPAGAGLRAIVRQGSEATLDRLLAEQGATTRSVEPSFEDLFLVATAEAEQP